MLLQLIVIASPECLSGRCGGWLTEVVVVPILMCSFVFLSLSLSPPLSLPWENGPGAEKQSRPAWAELFTSRPSPQGYN